jgi:hypothetical protein
MNYKVSYVAVMAFLLGYFISDVVNNTGGGLIPKANADVAGMSYMDLKRDYDFKRAVKYIVDDDCSINVGNGYIDGDYVYGINAEIDC